jgi:O-antigen/teichoic acid export membrane protein
MKDRVILVLTSYGIWIMAVVFSLFLGIYGWVKEIEELKKEKISDVFKMLRKVFQFNFQFIGSFAGWICLYALSRSYINTSGNLKFKDLILFLLGITGVTGHLSDATWKIIDSLSSLLQTLDRLAKK